MRLRLVQQSAFPILMQHSRPLPRILRALQQVSFRFSKQCPATKAKHSPTTYSPSPKQNIFAESSSYTSCWSGTLAKALISTSRYADPLLITNPLLGYKEANILCDTQTKSNRWRYWAPRALTSSEVKYGYRQLEQLTHK